MQTYLCHPQVGFIYAAALRWGPGKESFQSFQVTISSASRQCGAESGSVISCKIPKSGISEFPPGPVRWTLWIWPLGEGTKGRVSRARQQTHFVSLIFWASFHRLKKLFWGVWRLERVNWWVIRTLGRFNEHLVLHLFWHSLFHISIKIKGLDYFCLTFLLMLL